MTQAQIFRLSLIKFETHIRFCFNRTQIHSLIDLIGLMQWDPLRVFYGFANSGCLAVGMSNNYRRGNVIFKLCFL